MKKFTKNYFKAGLMFVLIFSMLILLFTGCVVEKKEAGATTKPTTKAETSESSKTEEPVVITVMLDYGTVEPPSPELTQFKELEKRLNADFQILWVPQSVWDERLSVTLASGNLTKVLYVHKNPNIITAARYGAFWEITPYLNDYEFLRDISPITVEADSIDGKYYGISRLRDLASTAFIYRLDWLETLALKKPEILDEFYEMLRAFTYDDPDKNGKDDTTGFIIDGRLWILEELAIYLGAPNFFGVSPEGKIFAHIDTPEYFEAAKFTKKLYDEKIMNQDFAIIPSSAIDPLMYEGKSGCYHGAVDNYWGMRDEIQKNVPTADLDCIIRLENDRTRAWNAGSMGMFAFTRSGIKSEEELKKILAVYDKMMSDPEMQNIIQYGIENITYRIVDGYVEGIPEDERKEVGSAGLNLLVCGKAIEPTLKKKEIPEAAKAKEYLAMNEKNAVMNYSLPFTSDTWTLKGGELNQLRKDAKINFVMGEIDEAGWKAFIK